MYKLNLTLTISVTTGSILFFLYLLTTGSRSLTDSIIVSLALIGLSIVSLAYTHLVLRAKNAITASQVTILVLYIINAGFVTVLSGSFGLLPILMKSGQASTLIEASSYIWPNLIIFGTPSIAFYIFAFLYTRKSGK
jgi:hypothetical protein